MWWQQVWSLGVRKQVQVRFWKAPPELLAQLLLLMLAWLPLYIGADVVACIYLPTPPTTNFTVDFHAGSNSDNCMNSYGKNASASVTTPGFTCASVGYVEEKASGSCIFEDSIWGLSFTGGTYNGSTLSKWSSSPPIYNECSLSAYSPGTSVCGDEEPCLTTDVQWNTGTTGPIFVRRRHPPTYLVVYSPG